MANKLLLAYKKDLWSGIQGLVQRIVISDSANCLFERANLL